MTVGRQIYVKKPIPIEAIEYKNESVPLIIVWLKDNIKEIGRDYILIKTLEGNIKASLGDYIIQGVRGEFYPCKPDIFKETYLLAQSYDKLQLENRGSRDNKD